MRFYGRTVRVCNALRVEASIALEFDVSIRKVFRLDFEVPRGDARRAMHCLVMLVGGKKVAVEPDLSARSRWGSSPEVNATLYLLLERDLSESRPIGFVANLDGRGQALDVAAFMRWLGDGGFQTSTVKEVVFGYSARSA